MLWVPSALACDEGVLDRLPRPAEVTAEPAVQRGTNEVGGVTYAGARVSYRSAHSVAEWAPVLDRPEDQDDWHPGEFGTERVERLDASTIFQQLDIQLLWGAVKVKRQVVVGIEWFERGVALRNCWSALDPEPWRPRIATWVSDAPFQRHGFGGWDVRPLRDGGSAVSYSFWVDGGAIPASVQAWAMGRTLPDLMRAFEGYVGSARAGG